MADNNKTKETKKEGAKGKTVAKLVDEISKLTVLELSELVSELQEKLGVSAMPVAQATPVSAPQASGNGEGQAQAEEGGARNLIMTASGESKIAVIKALREINSNWGLKEAKDMTENLPADVIKDGKPEEVKEGAEKLKAAGAQVELK